jgi:hypothetical protein
LTVGEIFFYTSKNYGGFMGWDGMVNGKTAPNRIYIWSLKFDLIAPDEIKKIGYF